jgi:hypothetical protein
MTNYFRNIKDGGHKTRGIKWKCIGTNLITGFLYMIDDCILIGVLNKASETMPNICSLVQGTPDAIIF